jgi:hypothetical protein
VNLRIRADYPATDGSMPESVEVEWTEVEQAGEGAPLSFAPEALDILLKAPRGRTAALPHLGPYLLIDTVGAHELVGVDKMDGVAHRVKNTPMSTEFDLAGYARTELKAGTRIQLVGGQWEEA